MNDDSTGRSRRRFLQAAGAAGLAAFAGCAETGDQSGTTTTPAQTKTKGQRGEVSLADFRGSGPLVETRPPIEGPRIDDLPDLSGELSIYLGGGEGGLYTQLIDIFRKLYPDFDVSVRSAPTAQLANTIIQETKAGKSPADVFWAVDVGALGAVANAGATAKLPDDLVKPVPDTFHPDNQWVGVAGRARSVPYNTDHFSESDIPKDVFAFAEESRFKDAMGWAPTYGAFQTFVTAMRLQRGEAKTKEWLNGMQAQNVSTYPDEFLISNAVADGEIYAGFANHYYALRVKASRPNAPIDLAFTSNDAGALINAAGTAAIKGTKRKELAVNFMRHLLSAEAQEFFATRTFAYPMIPGVPPVGGLPRIDQLNPPDVDVSKLSEIKPTLRLMTEAGVL